MNTTHVQGSTRIYRKFLSKVNRTVVVESTVNERCMATVVSVSDKQFLVKTEQTRGRTADSESEYWGTASIMFVEQMKGNHWNIGVLLEYRPTKCF